MKWMIGAATALFGMATTAPAAEITPATAPAAFATATPDPFARIRGMTVSCPMAGEEWGSDEMVRTLGILRNLGVNWVAIHPYGGLRNDGTVGRSRIDQLYDNPYWLKRAIREAHALDMKILIKPHLAYWGSRFSWRGEIAFEEEAAQRRFFETYRDWIVRVAELSREADAFAVGTELEGTVHDEAAWRGIIADVRDVMDVPLTYSASWDRYESVPFWDALDAIAVQSYFPLVEHERRPDRQELVAGWQRIVDRLEEFGRRHERTVVLGELGYNRSLSAAVRPWSYGSSDDPAAEALQVECLETALQALSGSSTIAGAFLWKWFPGEYPRGNFLHSTPAMRGVLAGQWGSAAKDSPSRGATD